MENLFISSSFQDFCINLFPGKKSLFCFSYLVVGGVCVGGGGGLCVYMCVCVFIIKFLFIRRSVSMYIL